LKPTIQDFLEDSINILKWWLKKTELVFTINYTVRHLYLKSLMWRKNIFLQRVSLEKSGFKAVNDVSFKLYEEKHRVGREWLW
jgi:hypothetical protein